MISYRGEFEEGRIACTFVLLLVKEIAERFLRLEKYIEEAEIELAEQQLHLVDYIRNSIVERLGELEKLWQRTLRERESKEAYDIDRAVSALVRLAASLERFKNLHKALRWFYTPWVEAETETFLRDFFNTPLSQQLFEELNVTVGLTEDYDFVNPYPAVHFGSRQPNTPNIVALPLIEKDNPLMWPVLMHEVGHALIQASDIDRKFEVTISSQKAPESSKRILHQWARELGSDLLALKLLGPSYLLAYLNFYSFIFHDPKKSIYAFHKDSKNTPSPVKRVEFLRARLQRMDHRFFIKGELLDFYWTLFEMRLELENKKRQYDFKSKEKEEEKENEEEIDPQISDQLYEKLQQLVVEEIEGEFSKLQLTEFHYDNDFTPAKELVKRLSQKELISSKRTYMPTETQVMSDLEKGDLLAACKRLREEPCRPVEIITAAWLTQLNHEFSIYYESRDVNNVPFDEELGNSEYSSRLVAKSIETARIHRTFLEKSAN